LFERRRERKREKRRCTAAAALTDQRTPYGESSVSIFNAAEGENKKMCSEKDDRKRP